MNNVFKSFVLLFCISMIFASCSDNAIGTDEQLNDLSQPLANNHAMDGIVTTDFEGVVVFEIPNGKGISKRNNCPALEHAQSELEDLGNCEDADLYCRYLHLWWQMDAQIAGINCGINGFCQFCSTFINFAQNTITTLIADQLHPVYVASLQQKLAVWQALCNNC